MTDLLPPLPTLDMRPHLTSNIVDDDASTASASASASALCLPPSHQHASLAKSMKPRGGPSKKTSKRAAAAAAASASAALLSGAAARSSASTAALSRPASKASAGAAAATPRHQRPSDPQWQLIRAFCFDTTLYSESNPSAALSCLRLVDSEGRCLPHLSRAFTLMHPSTKQKRIEADPDNTAYRFIRVYRNRSTAEERVACADLLAAFGGEDNAKQWKNKFPAALLIDPVGGQSRWTLSMSDFVLYVSLVHARLHELQGDEAARLLAWTKEATFASNLFRRDTDAAEMGRAFVQAVLEVFLTPQMVVRQIQLSGQGFIDEGRAAARAAAKAAAASTATAAGTAIAPEPLVAPFASIAPTSQLLQQPVQPVQSVESLRLTEPLEDEEEDPTDMNSVAEEQDETPPSSQQEQPPQPPSDSASSSSPYSAPSFLPYSSLSSPSMLASSPVHSADAEDCESLADGMELEAEEGEAPMMAAAAASFHPLDQLRGFELGFEADEFYEHPPRVSAELQQMPQLPSLFGQMRSLSDSSNNGGSQPQRSNSGASTNNSSGIDFLN